MGDIFDALVRRGVIVGGQNPKANLSQKLSAHPDLKSYGKRGWYFADKEPPQRSSTHLFDQNEKDPEPFDSEPFHVNGATSVLAADTANYID